MGRVAAAERRMQRRPVESIKPPGLKLYWCWTDDHDEAWFVVARSARQARRLYELYEGYGPGDVRSELVAVIPERFQSDQHVGWPDRPLLESCGATIERWETPRVVHIKDIRLVEGTIEPEILSEGSQA